MLYIAKSLRDLNFGALMEVYREGNLENAKEFWPELPQGQGILWAEQEFKSSVMGTGGSPSSSGKEGPQDICYCHEESIYSPCG